MLPATLMIARVKKRYPSGAGGSRGGCCKQSVQPDHGSLWSYRERTISPENPTLGVPQDHRFPVRVAAFAASAVGPEAVALGPIFIRRGGRRALWELSTRRGLLRGPSSF